MDLASLYIILGSISFITSVVTLGVLIKKFIEQPAAHGFFVYSDTIASALLSLGLLLDGVKTMHSMGPNTSLCNTKPLSLPAAPMTFPIHLLHKSFGSIRVASTKIRMQVISLKPSLADKNCYQFKLLYGLFVVAIVTGFFSVLGQSLSHHD